jgi:hypothetical protein
MNDKQHSKPSEPMTVEAASRIYSETSKQNDGVIPKDSFAARAMSAAMRNAKEAAPTAPPKAKQP